MAQINFVEGTVMGRFITYVIIIWEVLRSIYFQNTAFRHWFSK